MPKEIQINLAVLGKLIAESSFELTDASRWTKIRFAIETGQNWRGPKLPMRIESHVKRLVVIVLFNTVLFMSHY